MKVELDLSNYATKADFKNAKDVDTSKFAKTVGLASLKFNVDKSDFDNLKNVPINESNLKSKVDKLNVDKVVLVPVDLNQLSDVVKNDVVKKTEYNAKIKNIEDEMSDITNLATTAAPNFKINEVKNKIPNINNILATFSAINLLNSGVVIYWSWSWSKIFFSVWPNTQLRNLNRFYIK